MDEKLKKEIIFNALVEGITNEELVDYIHQNFGFLLKKKEVEKIAYEIRNNPEEKRILDLMKFQKKLDIVTLTKILELLKSGFLFVEVAAQLSLTEENVKVYLYQLQLKTSPFFDMELYQQFISQEKALNAMNEEELFARYENLEKKYGCEIETLSNNKMVSKYVREKRNRQVVEEYVKSNFTLKEQFLATKYHLDVVSVKFLLYNKDLLLKYTSLENAEEILKRRQADLKEKVDNYNARLGNLSFVPFTKDRKIEKVIRNLGFWIQIITNFKLSLSSFATLIGYQDVNNLQNALFHYTENRSPLQKGALIFIFNTYKNFDSEQLRRAANFVTFFNTAKKEGKTEEAQSMVRSLYAIDKAFLDICKSKKSGENLSDAEREVILHYKVKYAVPWSMFPFSKSAILNFTNPIPEDLADELEVVEAYLNTSPSRK